MSNFKISIKDDYVTPLDIFTFFQYAKHNNNESDKKVASYLKKQYFKSLLITNTILSLVYFARHKNYRNSHLFMV